MSKTTHPVSSNHPWKRASVEAFKLKEARKVAERIYNKTSPIRNDEFRKLKQKEYSRNAERRKAGIPTELPVMHPWDFEKGRVKP